MEDLMKQFWGAADHMFALASAGNEDEARRQIQVSLQAHQAALSIAVARQLVANNEAEQQAGERIQEIYFRVQRQVLLFLLADAGTHRADQLVSHSFKPTTVPAPVGFIGAAQRAGAEANRHAGVNTAAYLPRAARRVRADPHRNWFDAATVQDVRRRKDRRCERTWLKSPRSRNRRSTKSAASRRRCIR